MDPGPPRGTATSGSRCVRHTSTLSNATKRRNMGLCCGRANGIVRSGVCRLGVNTTG